MGIHDIGCDEHTALASDATATVALGSLALNGQRSNDPCTHQSLLTSWPVPNVEIVT